MKAVRRVVKFGVALSVIWALLILGGTARAYFAAKPFDVALTEPCTQLLNQLFPPVERWASGVHPMFHLPVVVWTNKKTGEVISTFRKWARAEPCWGLENRAARYAEQQRNGKIEPVLTILHSALAKMILVPIAALWVVLAICVFVAVAFRAFVAQQGAQADGPAAGGPAA